MKIKSTFNSFSVNDVAKAKDFYQNILGLTAKDTPMGGLDITLPSGGGSLYIYKKDNHQPATFTVLNFEGGNIDEAVDDLAKKGVRFERYDGFGQDEKGIARGRQSGRGPDIAWFKDPAGNILSVLSNM